MDDVTKKPEPAPTIVPITVYFDGALLDKAVRNSKEADREAFVREAISYYMSVTAAESPFAVVRMLKDQALHNAMLLANTGSVKEFVASAVECYTTLIMARAKLAKDEDSNGAVIFIGVRLPDGTQEHLADVFDDAKEGRLPLGTKSN